MIKKVQKYIHIFKRIPKVKENLNLLKINLRNRIVGYKATPFTTFKTLKTFLYALLHVIIENKR